jgi:hypothetical protein
MRHASCDGRLCSVGEGMDKRPTNAGFSAMIGHRDGWTPLPLLTPCRTSMAISNLQVWRLRPWPTGVPADDAHRAIGAYQAL